MLAKAAVAVAPFEKTGDLKTALTMMMTAMMVAKIQIELMFFYLDK